MAYTPNIDDQLAALGISAKAGGGEYNTAFTGQAQGAPKSAGGFSFGNMASSAVHLGGQAVSWAAHQVIDPVVHATRGVAQYIPGGGVDQHYKAQESIQKSVDAIFKDAARRYKSTDPKVHISKEEYTKRISQATKMAQDSNQATQDYNSQLETPKDVYTGLGETALMLSGLGELKAAATVGKGVGKLAPDLQAALEGATGKAIGKVAPNVAKVLTPAQKGAAVVTGGDTVKGVAKGLAKFALATKPAADAAIETPSDIKEGNWGNVALNAGAFVGAPALMKGAEVAATKFAEAHGQTIGDAAKGLFFNKTGAEINKLKFQGGETVGKYLDGLKKTNPKAYQKYSDIAKVAEDHYQTEGTKAYHLNAYHQKNNMPVGNMTAQKFLDMQHDLATSHNWVNNNLDRVAFDARGKIKPETAPAKSPITGTPFAKATAAEDAANPLMNGTVGKAVTREEQKALKSDAAISRQVTNESQKGNFTVGRFDNQQAAEVTKALVDAKDTVAAHAFLDAADHAGADYTKNPLVMSKLRQAASMKDPTARAAALKDLNRTVKLSIKGSGRTGLKNGYFPIYTEKPIAGFKSATEAANLAADHHAPFAVIGNAMRKAGISPEGTDPRAFGQAMSANFSTGLQGTRFAPHAPQIMSKLFEAMDQTVGVFDPRLLKLSSIARALDVSRDDAKLIRNAVDAAYLKVPLGARSLGEKLTDFLISKFPGERQYLKAQSYGRFAGNPIFWLKRDIKTELVAGAEVGGKVPNLGATLNRMIGTAPSDETMHLLKERGFFSKGMSQVGDSNDFLGDYAATFGADGKREAGAAISKNGVKENFTKTALASYQQQSLGQMAEKFASMHGTTVKNLMADNGEMGTQFDHLMRLTVGYGQKAGEKGGYLTSDFAKTLNVLVFPSRFDTKVGMAFAKFYSQQPPVIQGAIAKGVLNVGAFLQSPEGEQWQKDNSEVLALLKYFTPVETVGTIVEALRAPGQAKLPDFGAIGGLPMGVFTAIAQHQGVAPDWLKSSPYHDPKTGNIMPDTLPVTDKARIQSALTDIISFMVSYPGATLGLQSKTKVIQGIVPGLKPAPGETKQVDPVTGATVASKASGGAWTSPQDIVPETMRNFAPQNMKVGSGVIDASKYSKPKKPKAPPAYLNGFKTRTARPLK